MRLGELLDDRSDGGNKRLFTPSFVAVAAGAALCTFAVFAIILDARRRSRAADATTWPLVALGRNALVVFLAERLLVQTAGMVHVGTRTVQGWLLDDVLPVGKPAAHLAYSGLLLLVVLAVTGLLHRHRRYLAL